MSALAQAVDVELLTPDDVAALLKVSTWTVFNEAREGRLGSVRIGRCVRFTRDDVARFIRSHRSTAVASSDRSEGAPRVVQITRRRRS